MDRGVEERRGYDRPRSKNTLAATIDGFFFFFGTVTSTWVDVLGQPETENKFEVGNGWIVDRRDLDDGGGGTMQELCLEDISREMGTKKPEENLMPE